VTEYDDVRSLYQVARERNMILHFTTFAF
jgi:hypothetical protein